MGLTTPGTIIPASDVSCPAKIKIAFIAAPVHRALPFKSDTAHISVNTVIAQAERACQFFAAEQFAIFHIGALQNVHSVMSAVVFNLRKFETRISAEHCANHPMKNLKEKRANKWYFRCNMQTFPVGFNALSYGFFYRSQGLFARDILNHLQINSRSREYHSFAMYFFFGKSAIFVT